MKRSSKMLLYFSLLTSLVSSNIQTTIFDIIQNGSLETLQKIVKTNFSQLLQKNEQNESTLQVALKYRRGFPFIKLILKMAPQLIQWHDDKGRTPLHSALLVYDQLFPHLFPDLKDKYCMNLPDALADLDYVVAILPLLLEVMDAAALNKEDKEGKTALHYAARIDYNQREFDFNTEHKKITMLPIFSSSILINQKRLIELLVKEGASPFVIDHAEKYPKYYAQNKEIKEHIEYLEAAITNAEITNAEEKNASRSPQRFLSPRKLLVGAAILGSTLASCWYFYKNMQRHQKAMH